MRVLILKCWGCSITVVRSTVVVSMVVVQSKWKKVECREEGDSVLNPQHSASFLVTPVNA